MMKPGERNSNFPYLVLIGLLLLALPACQSAFFKQPTPVRIGLPALEQSALVFTAEEQGFFRQNGLQVTIHQYDSGVKSLNALLQSEVDLAVAAEFPVVSALLNKDQIMVLASTDKFENDFIVARLDRGIVQIADLKGKRIGVAQRTINEFFLARFLELNGMHISDVVQVDLEPKQFVEAIVSGQVDALIAWQPYIQEVEQQLKETVTWPAQSSQFVYSVLVARNAWLAEHPETSALFMKSLLQAEDYLVQHPEESRTIVQNRLGYTSEYISSVWPNHEFSLTLDNSLIVAMNDEARWLIRSGLSTEGRTPDFYEVIYSEGLKAIKPEAVTIHR